MIKRKVLFVCIHNSARSQMAEAFLNEIGGDSFIAESAGLEPGVLNPNVVKVMSESGIDISNKPTKSVFDLFRAGVRYDAVITVCDGASAERCPVFPGRTKRVAWSFPDPSQFKGSADEVLAQTRIVRDQVKTKVGEFISEARELSFWL